MKTTLYDLKVKLFPAREKRGKQPMLRAKTRRLLFYVVFMAVPVTQFCIFYIGVNFNLVMLAFKKYEVNRYVWHGFDNFTKIIRDLTSAGSVLNVSIINSLIVFAVGLFAGLPLALFFSYYIYKKRTGSRFFRVILFLPSIISVIVMVVLFRYFVGEAIPAFVEKVFKTIIPGPLDPSTGFSMIFGTIVFFGVWSGFGVSVLLYTGAMARIPPEITEYAAIDGVSDIQEFFYITLPMIYPTVTAFMVIAVANIFISQANLYEFYGDDFTLPDSKLTTIGFYLFRTVMSGTTGGVGTGFEVYPYAAAGGVIFTLIAAPLTLLVKWGLEKLGPKAEY